MRSTLPVLVLALATLLLAAPVAGGSSGGDPASAGAAAARDFGAGVSLREPTALAAVIASPEAFDARPLVLEGRLVDLCMKKGCWTVLADGDAHVRVRFKDYGFFLPQDARGSRALVEGEVRVRTMSEREAKHLARETRGGDPSAIDGPQREVEFIASGVRVVGAPPTTTR